MYTLEHETAVQAIAYDESTQLIIVGTANGVIYMWSCDDGSCTASVTAHDQRIRALEFAVVDDASYLISGASDGVLKLWELVSSKLLRLVQEVDLDCRLTALCLATEAQPEEKKAKPDMTKKPAKSILKRDPAPAQEDGEPVSEPPAKQGKKKRRKKATA